MGVKPRKGLRDRGMLRTWWKKTTQNHMKRVTHGPPRLTLREWKDRLEDFEHSCAYCGEAFDDERRPEIEHLLPLSRGGVHRVENVVPACADCNKRKGTMTYDEFMEKERHG